ncbi:MAG: MarC family protein [Phycisphaerales bacterium]
MEFDVFIQTSLYFLALINPASKVFILSSMQPGYNHKTLFKVSAKASGAALIILYVLASVGHYILHAIFHVEIYSLSVAGGVVLFIIGLTAVRNGRFYEQSLKNTSDDISIVPLAAPLIAGPGTITASISFASTHGVPITILSLTAAVVINFFIMLSSLWIGKILEKYQIVGPLIRITGLIVSAVAVQMVLTGLSEWLKITIST